jgi:hypothetical protein
MILPTAASSFSYVNFPNAIPTQSNSSSQQVFDDGEFSEDSTFSVTDWMSHVPKEVLAKNFKVNASAFDHIPDRQLWMLPSVPPPKDVNQDAVTSPQGVATLPYTFAASKANSTKVSACRELNHLDG